MNKQGHPSTLQSQQVGNTNAVRSGVYSERLVAPRAQEIAEALLDTPHRTPLDQIGAEEIGRLIAIIERIDADLAERGLTDKRGGARSLVEMRCRYSTRLERWLHQYAATPASRAEFLRQMGLPRAAERQPMADEQQISAAAEKARAELDRLHRIDAGERSAHNEALSN